MFAGSMTALVTPFKDGEVDYAALEAVARAVGEALGYKPDRVGVIGRSGVSGRKKTDVGVVSMRAGQAKRSLQYAGCSEAVGLT